MKKEMTFQQKYDLISAVCLVADWWGVEPISLVGFTAHFEKPEKKDEWNAIAREVQDFEKLDFRDRAVKLGFSVIYPDEDKIEVVL